MTRKIATAAALVAIAWLPLQGAFTPAEAADFGFSAWGSFRVGGIHLSLGAHSHGPYAAYGPYYRFDQRVAYRGYNCGAGCYIDRGVAYHHYNCPVALHHFRAHRAVPPQFGPYVDSWGRSYYRYEPPRAYGRWAPPRSPIVYYPRYGERYDSRYGDRHRWEGRYDRRRDAHPGQGHGHHKNRGRGHDHHQHNDSCRHW